MTRAANTSYGANYFRSDAVPQDFTQLGLKTKSKAVIAKPGAFAWDLEGFYTSAEDILVLNPMELSYRFADPYAEIRVGRVLQEWSAGDDFWRRGNWQPRFQWNKFDSLQQGLVGLHIGSGSKDSQWTFMASPFFVPEFGPQIKLVDGQFASSNPWFRPPPAEVSVLNEIVPTNYNLSNPTIEDVVLNPSVAMRFEQTLDQGVVALSYAYKPMNQLIYTAPFNLDLSGPEDEEMVPLDIEVQTRVVRHHILTGEILYHLGEYDAIFSGTLERPVDNAETNETYLNQNLTDAVIADLIVVPNAKRYSSFKPYIGYMRLWGGDQPTDNEFVEGSFVFERRQQFFEAVRVGASYLTSVTPTSRVTLRQELSYDLQQLGGASISEIRLEFDKNKIFGLKYEAIGILSEIQPAEEQAFLRDYRANDRLTVEYSYVF